MGGRMRQGNPGSSRALSLGTQDSSGPRQPQHPLPQVAHRLLRAERRGPTVEAPEVSPHAQTRQLVESSRNRNQPLFPPVPRLPPDRRSGYPKSPSPSLEPANQPTSSHHPTLARS